LGAGLVWIVASVIIGGAVGSFFVAARRFASRAA
jgi:hypothetical protein